MTDKTQQEDVSEYDAEWELESDDPLDNEVSDDNDQQTDAEQPARSEPAPEDEGGETSDKSKDNSAESESEEDIWANATPAQKEAYIRAENERKAAANRIKTHEDRLAERGRELKTLRDEKRALEQAAVQPTEFESQNEVYGKDINEMIDRKIQSALPEVEPEEQLTPQQVEQQVFETITAAHPDAGDVYNSPELQQMLAENPPVVIKGRAYLFSEALHSNDPNEVVEALNHYKETRPTPTEPPAAEDGGLASMQSPNASSTAPDMRTTSQLSTREQYDREWDEDDS